TERHGKKTIKRVDYPRGEKTEPASLIFDWTNVVLSFSVIANLRRWDVTDNTWDVYKRGWFGYVDISYQFKAITVTRFLLYCSLSRFLKHFFSLYK
ncbi:unnamed protein product, partial [Brassica napus]